MESQVSICFAKKNAQKQELSNLHVNDNRKAIFKLSRNITGYKQDIVREKCVKKDDCSITFSDADKLTAWKDHYMYLLNTEFS